MKPTIPGLAVVTVTVDAARAFACFQSWVAKAAYHWPTYIIEQTLPDVPIAPRVVTRNVIELFAPDVHLFNQDNVGVVAAFAKGVQCATADGAHLIVCLHDDVFIQQVGWDDYVWGNAHWLSTGRLATGHRSFFGGFGGGTGLGSDTLYKAPYNPMQLARQGFVSNLADAEAHGTRRYAPVKCVCFDGFCQIGTADWFPQAWTELVRLGLVHHFYDGALGCLARRAGLPHGWMLPIQCQHLGGQTAVGSAAYQAWAKTQRAEGDQGFWTESHRIGYEAFKDVLPLRLGGR